MGEELLTYHLFLIFAGAAVLATVALFARQAMIVAYIVLGLLLGPAVFNLVPDPELIQNMSDVGIIFLLFLLGLNLHPQKLITLFKSTLLTTLATCLVFGLVGGGFALLLGLSAIDALIVGVAMMFSSTIIGLKLLPTTILHHQHTGEIIISILLLQDIIAIICLLLIKASAFGTGLGWQSLSLFISLPLIVLLAKILQEHVISKLIARFDTIQEYVFLVSIGWCLGFAELAHWLGLSSEMGAFIAGVALAASPISTFIAESLKPLRDFFLVLFFFALGAAVEINMIGAVFVPAVILAMLVLVIKPLMFRWLLGKSGEPPSTSKEIGFRLGQISEFSLLISVLALSQGLISAKAAYLIQAAALLTFVVSPYLIVLRYPTPIAVSSKLRRD